MFPSTSSKFQLTMDHHDQTLREAIKSQSSFSLNLSAHLISLPEFSGTNLCLSPLSLHSVLSLLAAGCTGPTCRQLLSFLGFSDVSELSALHSNVSNLLLDDGSATGGPCIRYASGVWLDDGTSLKKAFREIVGLVYRAEAHPVPFSSKPEESANQINKWVEQVTTGCIKDLIDPKLVSSDTRLVLGNALYFNGKWSEKFDHSHTRTGTFHLTDGSSIETPFMTSTEDQFISVYDGFKVLKLPYNQGQDRRQFSFYIFLPDVSDGLLNLSKKLSSEPDFITDHTPWRKVPVKDFRIPKFKISRETAFSEILKNQGILLPFTATGDFSEIVNSIEVSRYCVSEIVHKCFVEVNEEGTEAAAASGATMMLLSYQRPVSFVADHPFLFLIREDTTGAVIFSGKLQNPVLSE